ncbi:hypothetical protein LZ838_09275 [Pseudomonas sp. AA27]|uniref:hypothetical protein n=1 Tax=Pseudomonas sp. AA27 TaxID=2908652 RepID=UPI001F1FED95|nr:hypothetical protein [Pseudomonas sp. AA27]MCF1487552.1 hypothetical protein [Pseudomonas sp. AA27]
MSEERKVHRFTTTMDDFIRFLEAKTGESRCPVCNFQRWVVLGAPSTETSYRMVTTLRDGAKPTFLSSFSVYCSNCGFIRQHIARVVKEWVDENPPPEQLELEDLDEDSPNDDE